MHIQGAMKLLQQAELVEKASLSPRLRAQIAMLIW